MKHTIAFITTKLFHDYIVDIIVPLKERCTFSFFEYSSLEEIPSLYLDLASKYDGICTTGAIPYEIILRTRGGIKKPLASIASDPEEYYKEFFLLQNKNRSIDFSRIIVDATLLLEGEQARSVLDIFVGDVSLNDMRDSAISKFSTHELLQAIPNVIAIACDLWEKRQVDMFICKFSSVARELDKRKIPHTFIYPGENNILKTLDGFIKEIEFSKMPLNLQAAIFITSSGLQESDADGINTISINLQRCLLDFDKEHMTQFFIQKSFQGFEIFTSGIEAERLTEHYTCCFLNNYLYNGTGTKTRIGYGVAKDIVQARASAIKACKGVVQDGQSCLISENGALVRLSTQTMEKASSQGSADVLLIAQNAGLSVLTIQRILNTLQHLQTNEITTQELAGALKVTVANANRFLNSLVKSGYAEIVSVQKAIAQGRPSRVYKINI